MSRLTQGLRTSLPVRGSHPLRPAFPDSSGSTFKATGLVRVRSPLLAESRLMSFPPGTEMFQFPGFASPRLCIQRGMIPKDRVSPFGYFRIKACSQLPGTFRRVPRPSSPLGAKASTKCPSLCLRVAKFPCATTKPRISIPPSRPATEVTPSAPSLLKGANGDRYPIYDVQERISEVRGRNLGAMPLRPLTSRIHVEVNGFEPSTSCLQSRRSPT